MSRVLKFSCRRPSAASLFIAFLPALAAVPANAEDGDATSLSIDPIVVSATRLPTPMSEVASSVTVISADEIKEKQYRTLPDALKSVPGLNVVQSGGPGGTASVYIRGTEARHTKVLVDGIDVSDSSSADGSFDFSQIPTEDIEKIEILRGPQSGLYGSDAIGGVVNIVTKKGEGPARFHATIEGGSFGTFNQTLGASGSAGRFNYALDVIHDRSTSNKVTPDGLIPLNKKNADDLSDRRTVSVRLGADLTDTIDVSLVGRATNNNLQNLDGSYSREYLNNNEYFTRGAIHQALSDGLFEQTLGVAYSGYRRRVGDDGLSLYRGDRVKGDWQGDVRLVKGETLNFGLESQRDGIDDAQNLSGTPNNAKAHVVNSAGFVGLQSDWEKRIENSISLRHDEHSRFGGKTTYRVAPAVLIPETGTKIKASYGTGFKAPTLDELYDNYPTYFFYANPNLKPETSIGYDAGFEQKLGGVRFGSTYFHNRIKNLIATNDTYTSMTNIGSAEIQGVENSVSFDPSRDVSLSASYTYTLAEDEVRHLQLLRRPRHKATLSGTFRPTDALTLTAETIFTGDWLDNDRSGMISRLKGSGYVTANLSAGYTLTENISVFGRITNLLDRRVENPVGYEQPGIGAFAGVSASF